MINVKCHEKMKLNHKSQHKSNGIKKADAEDRLEKVKDSQHVS